MTTNPAYRYRWWLGGLLLACSVLNYIDRMAISIVAPLIRDEFHLSNADYSLITGTFLLTYGIFYVVGGLIMDRIGPWIGIPVSVASWSLANMLHAVSRGLGHLCFFRALLAVGEASYFTAAVKAVQRVFPPADRSKGIAIMFMGIMIGTLIATPLVALLAEWHGWRMAFIVTGGMGFVLLPFWQLFLRKLRGQSAGGAEPQQIAHLPAGSGQEDSAKTFETPWSITKYRATWVLFVTRAGTDAAWYFYLFWLPGYFVQERGFDMVMIAKYLWIPFLMADVGYIVGGWLPSYLIHRGWSVNLARKGIMVAAGLMVPLGILAVFADNLLAALGLIGLSTIGMTAWGTNLTALHSDMYPEKRVGTVFGLTGTAGGIGGALLQFVVGPLIDRAGSYGWAFLIMGTLHPIGICWIVFALGKVRRL